MIKKIKIERKQVGRPPMLKEGKLFTFYLEEHVIEKLGEISEETSINRSEIVRLAINDIVVRFEKLGKVK